MTKVTTMSTKTVLLIVALVLACIAAFFPTALYTRVNFGWLAFAFYLASILFSSGWPPRAT
jgi:hypothetical protein